MDTNVLEKSVGLGAVFCGIVVAFGCAAAHSEGYDAVRKSSTIKPSGLFAVWPFRKFYVSGATKHKREIEARTPV